MSSPRAVGKAQRRCTIQTTEEALLTLTKPQHRLSIPELHLTEITDEPDHTESPVKRDNAISPHLLLVPDLPGKLNRSQSCSISIADDEAELMASRCRGRSHSLPPSILRKQFAEMNQHAATLEDDSGAGCLKPSSSARRVSFSLPAGSEVPEADNTREPVRPWTPRANELPNGKGSSQTDNKLPLVDMEIPREPLPAGSSVFQQVMADIAPTPRLRSPPPPPALSSPDSSPSPPSSPSSPPSLRYSPQKDVTRPKVSRQDTPKHSPRPNDRSPRR